MEHARLMRESFLATSDMLKSVQRSCYPNASTASLAKVEAAAKKIDIGKTTNSQSAQIQEFFTQAQQAVDELAKGTTWSDK
jgi:hypothetical protein